jgi:glycosyltransferase involved in cell wall biosynthesis
MHRPDRSPGQRYRFEQYLGDLREAGIQCTVSWLLSEEDDRIFYGPGNVLRKASIVLRSIIRRRREIRQLNQYDAVFIFREALMTGQTFFEKAVAQSKAKMILDFDDAIWLPDTSANNRMFRFLKRPSKTRELCAMADLVITGNSYLAEFAKAYNPNVTIIPTTIDLAQYHTSVSDYGRTPVVIGWTGSPTTIRHFRMAETVLMRIRKKYGEAVQFKVIGDSSYRNQELGITGTRWSAEREVEELQGIDIGIMPLPDDEWSKGKCACKGLQYMALGIPAVMSAVGTNNEVICSHENGILVSDDDSFFEALCILIESPELRRQYGQAGRNTVEERYSRQAWSAQYVAALQGVIR